MRPTAVRSFAQSASTLAKRRLVRVQLNVDVPDLGRAGELCLVQPGRMRNDLLPSQKAVYKPLPDPRARSQQNLLAAFQKQQQQLKRQEESLIKQQELKAQLELQLQQREQQLLRQQRQDFEADARKVSPMQLLNLRRSLEALPAITYERPTTIPIANTTADLPEPAVAIQGSISVAEVVDHIRTNLAAFDVKADGESSTSAVRLTTQQVASACEFSFATPSASHNTDVDGIDKNGRIKKTGRYFLTVHMASENAHISIPVIVRPASAATGPTSVPGTTRSYSTRARAPGPVERSLRTKLEAAFAPADVTIRNDSSKHAHHAAMVASGGGNGETHFFVEVISNAFEGMPQIKRHRAVNALFAEEFANGLHALSLRTRTHAEHDRAIEDEGDSPAPWQRGATLIAGVLGTFASGYLVLYADYGPQEHCFTSLRKAVLGPNTK